MTPLHPVRPIPKRLTIYACEALCRHMELRHLRYFVAVASARSVSLAARGLNVTQPGLSRQIQNLEQDLGVRLFDRIGRKIVLTGDGNELLGRARRILADAEAFRERAQALGGEIGRAHV